MSLKVNIYLKNLLDAKMGFIFAGGTMFQLFWTDISLYSTINCESIVGSIQISDLHIIKHLLIHLCTLKSMVHNFLLQFWGNFEEVHKDTGWPIYSLK
jgi:hypothetical protein